MRRASCSHSFSAIIVCFSTKPFSSPIQSSFSLTLKSVKMAEKIVDNILENLGENIAENVSKQKSVSSFFEGQTSSSVNSNFKRLFGRQKPVHHLLGGGKSADVFLWRNKKISASVLMGATAIWVLFEWLNYHFLTLLFVAMALGMLVQFLWLNVSGLFNRSPSKVPRLVLPSELFVNIGVSVGNLVNQALGFLQDVSCGGNLKQSMLVLASLWVAAVIGSWCNFLTVLYVGFVAAHTLPVLYEKYEDQVDSFVYDIFGQLQNQYQKLDAGFLSKIPKGKLKGKSE
ncbi:reticulon-like protein B8 isoform X2 [Mangifera indica]|uniref:reticulon-like protein B8 isoform X2 n=1 Tax=Mangifera indica TaxID=29780 RepID=UPI001CF99F85|nr:reticulon-like protein B8 isoform X2 [Mangifera indica]